jgi:hypothetical protein
MQWTSSANTFSAGDASYEPMAVILRLCYAFFAFVHVRSCTRLPDVDHFIGLLCSHKRRVLGNGSHMPSDLPLVFRRTLGGL